MCLSVACSPHPSRPAIQLCLVELINHVNNPGVWRSAGFRCTVVPAQCPGRRCLPRRLVESTSALVRLLLIQSPLGIAHLTIVFESLFDDSLGTTALVAGVVCGSASKVRIRWMMVRIE